MVFLFLTYINPTHSLQFRKANNLFFLKRSEFQYFSIYFYAMNTFMQLSRLTGRAFAWFVDILRSMRIRIERYRSG